MWFITFPIPTALDHTSSRTYHRAQKDVDTFRPGFKSYVIGSIVCQLLVPTCSRVYTRRECAHIIRGADTVTGIIQA